ncbi:lipid-binding SYLF domain-containing protein [Bacteroidota bacterium]
MKTMLNLLLVSILTISVGTLIATPSNGDNKSVENEKAAKTLEQAVRALDNIMEDPGNGIPQSLINKSEGIVIFPGASKVASGPFNGPGGSGIAMIHNEDGSWSNPFFVALREGNLGFQIGAQASDIVLLFKDRNDIIDIDKAEITLGDDVGVAAGPANNDYSSSTDITFETEIYSYHRSNGLFVGVNLKGIILSYNEKISDALYMIDEVNADEIFYGTGTPYNDKVNDLIVALNMYGK